MAETSKKDVIVDIKLPQSMSLESPNARIPFFGSRHRRKESTCVIFLLVALNLVVFVATMFINDCPRNSNSDCILKSLGRFSFQPLSENPFLGPSSSTLIEMGALQRTIVLRQHQQWRLLTFLWLHAGAFHLFLNISSLIFVGIRLERDFGPLRIGIIFILSAFLGSLTSALYVQNSLAVGSSGALSGLLGAMLSGLVQNWGAYTKKFVALAALFLLTVMNFILGFLPLVDNFANIGAFTSGILLGSVLLFDPRLSYLEPRNGLFDYDVKSSARFKHKLDKPTLRIASLSLFCLIFAACLVAVVRGVNANKYCSWCHFINCFPTKMWSCSYSAIPCEAMVSGERLTLICKANGRFRTYPFGNISQARTRDLCSLICS